MEPEIKKVYQIVQTFPNYLVPQEDRPEHFTWETYDQALNHLNNNLLLKCKGMIRRFYIRELFVIDGTNC